MELAGADPASMVFQELRVEPSDSDSAASVKSITALVLPSGPVGPVGPVAPVAPPPGPVGPVGPVAPAPVGPVGPVGPVTPAVPTPVGPVGPVGPSAPGEPSAPVGPVGPVGPVCPAPVGPVGPVEPVGPAPVDTSPRSSIQTWPVAITPPSGDMASKPTAWSAVSLMAVQAPTCITGDPSCDVHSTLQSSLLSSSVTLSPFVPEVASEARAQILM